LQRESIVIDNNENRKQQQTTTRERYEERGLTSLWGTFLGLKNDMSTQQLNNQQSTERKTNKHYSLMFSLRLSRWFNNNRASKSKE
jgi:hypothetical protein